MSCVHICFKQNFQILNILLYLFSIQAYLFKQRCILFQGKFFYKTDFTTYWQLDCDIMEDEFECFWLQAPYHTHISRQSQISFCCNWPAKFNIHANNIRLLLNKLYRCHFRNSDNNMFINPFTTRSMPLKRPKSKRVLSIMMQQFLFLDSFKIAYISMRIKGWCWCWYWNCPLHSQSHQTVRSYHY